MTGAASALLHHHGTAQSPLPTATRLPPHCFRLPVYMRSARRRVQFRLGFRDFRGARSRLGASVCSTAAAAHRAFPLVSAACSSGTLTRSSGSQEQHYCGTALAVVRPLRTHPCRNGAQRVGTQPRLNWGQNHTCAHSPNCIAVSFSGEL